MDLRIDYVAHKSHKVIEICKKYGNVQGKTIENDSKQYENKGNQQLQHITIGSKFLYIPS